MWTISTKLIFNKKFIILLSLGEYSYGVGENSYNLYVKISSHYTESFSLYVIIKIEKSHAEKYNKIGTNNKEVRLPR